jgi:hypothetical protein
LRTRQVPTAILLVLAAASIAGCGGDEPEGAPVATPSLQLSRDRVAIGSPIKLTYKFEVASGAKIDGDYVVFAHVLNPDGEQMWTDDHKPPTPTSAWKPGETIEYSRTVFVPNYPYVGEATIRVGLYLDEKRLPLSGTNVSRHEYVVARLTIVPQSENIFLVDKSGWHPAEVARDNPASEWKWTQQRAVTSFRNPRKDCTLYLEYDARVDLFTPPQQVTIRLGDQVVGTFPADSREKTLVTFPVTAAQLGQADMTELAIEVDRIFKPGGGDARELGIRVFHTFLEPR